MDGSKFQGTWVSQTQDPSKTNLEAFLKAVELEDQLELWKDASQTEVIEINGDEWTSTVTVDKYPGVVKPYKYKLGQEFEGTGFDGTAGTALITLKSDTEINEVNKWTSKSGKECVATVTKTVKGDIMEVVTTVNGVSMTSMSKKSK